MYIIIYVRKGVYDSAEKFNNYEEAVEYYNELKRTVYNEEEDDIQILEVV